MRAVVSLNSRSAVIYQSYLCDSQPASQAVQARVFLIAGSVRHEYGGLRKQQFRRRRYSPDKRRLHKASIVTRALACITKRCFCVTRRQAALKFSLWRLQGFLLARPVHGAIYFRASLRWLWLRAIGESCPLCHGLHNGLFCAQVICPSDM